MSERVIEAQTVWQCPECAEFSLEEGDLRMYECGSCGTVFSYDDSYDGGSHRCPQCMKFSSRLDGYGCASCGQGIMEQADAYICWECEEIFGDEEDLRQHYEEAHPDPEEKPRHDPETAALIAGAAEAIEVFTEDELEEYANGKRSE